MGKLEGHVVIVTGGAHGIGRAYCERLAREGANVVVADIDGLGAEEAALSIRKSALGVDLLGVEVDVSDPEGTQRMAEQALNTFGRIDGLVNNAAVYQRPSMSRVPFEEIPVDEWDRLMAVNLRGPFLSSRAVVPQMKRQQYGKIINISSGTAYYGPPHLAHYVTSKAGIIGLTRVLARELGDYGICVNTVAPGFTQSLDEPTEDFIAALEQRAQQRAIKRIQQPEDLVGSIVFFCSEDSDFITGQVLVVDGGATMN